MSTLTLTSHPGQRMSVTCSLCGEDVDVDTAAIWVNREQQHMIVLCVTCNRKWEAAKGGRSQ